MTVGSLFLALLAVLFCVMFPAFAIQHILDQSK